MRIVLDDEHANKDEGPIMNKVYDTQRQEWIEVGEEVFNDVSERALYSVAAMPRRRLGPYARYVVEWLDKLPLKPILINEGVRVVYRSSDESGDYYEVEPL